MPTIKKAVNENKYGNAVVSADVKSYADDPYFLQKAQDAKATIGKVGLPGNKKK